jgi:UDP-2-acetamido-2,6-beta-L-arabino-hexul-4-ose reductase
MRRVVVTGAGGFIGRNLTVALGRLDDVQVAGIERADTPESLTSALSGAAVVYHLAGVNRPPDPSEFHSGNVGSTEQLCSLLRESGENPVVVLASSTQAERDNPYGRSKLAAEEVLEAWAGQTGGRAAIYRLPNVYGRWARPDYNSVVATFCHNTAHGLPLRVDDPQSVVSLVHIDDVVREFLRVLDEPQQGARRGEVAPVQDITVGELVARLSAFRAVQHAADVPDLSSHFDRALFSTYLSYLEPADLAFSLEPHTDARGSLAELLRERHAGQVFVSLTHPGVTRGDHYHDRKTERFMVIAGEGVVRLRRVDGDEVLAYHVSGAEPHAVIIPPGMVHSIENVGRDEMITLFWACEVFDPAGPDTYCEPVLRQEDET